MLVKNSGCTFSFNASPLPFLRHNIILCKVDFLSQFSLNCLRRSLQNVVEMQCLSSNTINCISIAKLLRIIAQVDTKISRIWLPINFSSNVTFSPPGSQQKSQTNERRMLSLANQQNTITNQFRNADKYISNLDGYVLQF